MRNAPLPEVKINTQLPAAIMARAARGIAYIAHPVRLRILEFLDVNGHASVSAIASAVGIDQTIASQHLKKMRDAHLVTTTRRGIFIYYEIGAEYPASIFVCLRKLFGHMTDQRRFLRDGHREILPIDYTTMAANRIKLFAHVDKMRILEYLTYRGESCVGDIMAGVQLPQAITSQYLKKLGEDGFVTARRDGRYVHYTITAGVHKTAIGCIHRRYERVGDAF
ncbi:transcriptional regulator [bacterium]|nr:transcriptional regulator [bacterium]